MGQKRYGYTFAELGIRIMASGSNPRVAIGRALRELGPLTPGTQGRLRDYKLRKGEKLTVVIERLD